jgi:hypothetical protein
VRFLASVRKQKEQMETPFYILLIAGHLGFFDVVYFHFYKCQLHKRKECHTEVLWHSLRHFIYAAQFIYIANFRFHGFALLALATLYACDVFIAWADVLSETASRKAQGGLPRGEYFMHVLLSLLIGAYLMSVAQISWPDRLLSTEVVISPPDVFPLLRWHMTFMGVSALCLGTHDMFKWIVRGRTWSQEAGTAS